jgi:hypothetical protein
MSDESIRPRQDPPAAARDLEPLVRSLASVDDGIVRRSRRELLAELREAIEARGDRRAGGALDRLDALTPRAPDWQAAVAALRAALSSPPPERPGSGTPVAPH